MYQDGATYQQVADRFGITRQGAHSYVTRHSVTRGRRTSWKDYSEAVALYDAGASIRELAAMCGVGYSNMYSVLKRRTVTSITKGPPRKDYSGAVAMYVNGNPIQTVADAHGISYGAMYCVLRIRTKMRTASESQQLRRKREKA